MVFQTPKVDFTVSFATLPLASDYYRKKIPYACQTKHKKQQKAINFKPPEKLPARRGTRHTQTQSHLTL